MSSVYSSHITFVIWVCLSFGPFMYVDRAALCLLLYNIPQGCFPSLPALSWRHTGSRRDYMKDWSPWLDLIQTFRLVQDLEKGGQEEIV